MDENMLQRAHSLFPDKTVYTIKEVAQILGKAPQTLYNNKVKYPLAELSTISDIERIIKRRPMSANRKRRTQPNKTAMHSLS